jgi:DNA-binding transcriptional ArsR family regulator
MLNAPTPATAEPATTEPATTEPTATEPTHLQLRSAAATFALLGSAPRLHLAWLMAHETSDVGTLARRVGLSIPTTSQHLAKLRLAGIVSARREGRHTYYTIEDPHVLTMLDQIFGHIAPDGTLAPDPVIPQRRPAQ